MQKWEKLKDMIDFAKTIEEFKRNGIMESNVHRTP